MANSTAIPPACQRCKRQTNPLIRDGDRQRFECTSCGETFWGQALSETEQEIDAKPLPGFAFAPISIPEKTATEGAEPRAKCEKCGKPYFNLGRRYDKHIATCDGSRKYRVRIPQRRRPVVNVPSPIQVYANSVAALLARRATLEAEIKGIDLAVSEINEKMKGAGGQPQAPFAVGSTQT